MYVHLYMHNVPRGTYVKVAYGAEEIQLPIIALVTNALSLAHAFESLQLS